jgi:DNA-binding transcriptional ArsR family regulator
MNLGDLQLKAGEAERLLKAMASRPRLMILCELLKGERTVTALHEAVGLSMSAMSQHLARLRADALVSTRRESQTIFYSLADAGATRMLETLYQIYCLPPDAAERRDPSAISPAAERRSEP